MKIILTLTEIKEIIEKSLPVASKLGVSNIKYVAADHGEDYIEIEVKDQTP